LGVEGSKIESEMVMVNGTRPSSGCSRLRVGEGSCSGGDGGWGVGGGGLLVKGRKRARRCESGGSFGDAEG